MIDLHCHILPDFAADIAHSLGEDTDGQAALEAAVKACRLASQQGLTRLVATPHIYPDNLEDIPRIRESVSRLQERLREESVKIQIFPGAEVAFSEDLPEGLAKTAGLSIANSKYLLVEPPLFCLPLAASNTFSALVRQGIRPILAHPERVMELQDASARIEELVEAGALVQITAAHLVGWGGRRLRRCCERMLKAGLVHFVASDMHFGDKRLLAMVPAWQRLVRLGGEETATRLMNDNPLAVLEGKMVQAARPSK
ncbi:MAG: phosphotransferase [Armatimonadetes bacterium]|nr:phosphotransferase [Armatimonadota bacterium]NIM23943.1 phosphotransferase [Armatimonadota bacterium]NIM67790.1 phosphotransferase [Armatimonadota bacterium]NIM76330.1 phosphotransferase [Armatimonadota bacterium]NIN06024.1 phosphotransferase [Armatimonadota bacterium]